MATSERRRIAANSLAKKLRLESEINRVMLRIFRKMAREAKILFAATGIVLSADKFKPEIEDELRSHYLKTMNAFKGDITSQAMKKFGGIIITKQNEEAMLDRRIDAFARTHSQEQAEIITQTNQKELDNALNAALLLLLFGGKKPGDQPNGQPPRRRPTPLDQPEVLSPLFSEPPPLADQIVQPSNAAVASVAAADLVRRATARAATIALTETQSPAEEVKSSEIDILVVSGAIPGDVREAWTAILDDVTRSAHAAADGQTVRHGEPFVVGGELLRRPGDTSLGASVGNTIRCRCSLSLA